jgi:hypothetical protein
MAVHLGATKAQHAERADRREADVRERYAEVLVVAGQGMCGRALRLYGLANAAVGALDCERMGAGVGTSQTSEDAKRDREAWAAVAGCFVAHPTTGGL